MKIFLHEITDESTELEFTHHESWVANAVAALDEKMEGETTSPFPSRSLPERAAGRSPERTVDAHFSLRKVDDVVVISGKIKTHLRLICSRCASAYSFQCQPAFSALFCKDPAMAGIAHLQKTGSQKNGPLKPVGQNHGVARHAHDFSGDSEDLLSTEKDMDITYVSQEYVDLTEVLSEQLRLEIPFQPLCKETCKGMCAQCGADLNAGRCACAKIIGSQPFSVLRDFKV